MKKLIWLLLIGTSMAQEVKAFHVTEVKAGTDDPICVRQQCVIDKYIASGYTDSIDYTLVCSELIETSS
jgi:hypothetical protein